MKLSISHALSPPSGQYYFTTMIFANPLSFKPIAPTIKKMTVYTQMSSSNFGLFFTFWLAPFPVWLMGFPNYYWHDCNKGKKFGCCTATSLDSKPLCHSHWRWKHFLLHTVEHLGFPSLFVTVFADEEQMNTSFWVQDRCNTHCFTPIHLLANYENKSRSNVLAYYYCLEFQKRGTPIYMLFLVEKHQIAQSKTIQSQYPDHWALIFPLPTISSTPKQAESQHTHRTSYNTYITDDGRLVCT